MHTLFINCTGYLLDGIIDSLTPTLLAELDRRVRTFTSFRDENGVATRRVTKLSSAAYLSAEMKVVHLFVLSHALGSRGTLLPLRIRHDVLVAISCLQTICYSVRNSRPYTREEHCFIFQTLGKRFFLHLTNIQHSQRLKKIEAAESFNMDKPPSKRRRVPYWKPAVKLPEESDNTASSSDGDVPPYFLRSEKIVPHAFVHFVEQVCMGGTHKFHDTAAPEASHTRNIGRAGQRSRTWGDLNASADLMLNFNNDIRLLEEICSQAKVDCDPQPIGEPYDVYPHHNLSPTTYTHIVPPYPTTYTHSIVVSPTMYTHTIICHPRRIPTSFHHTPQRIPTSFHHTPRRIPTSFLDYPRRIPTP